MVPPDKPGGMPTDLFWRTGQLPKDVCLPETGVPANRGYG